MASLSSLVALLAALAGGVIALFFSRPYFKRKGAQEAEQKAKEADHDQAQHIRRRAEAARERFGGDAVEQLREVGKLRSEKPDD